MKNRKHEILAVLRTHGQAGTPALERALGITRQALSRYLNALIRERAIERIGRTRGAVYRLVEESSSPFLQKKYPIRGLQEDLIFGTVGPAYSGQITENAKKILRYAFTELLNNAIEHSGAKAVQVELRQTRKSIAFTIRDSGVGAFAKIRKAFELPSTLDAVHELLKGKLTTDPARHSGEGIFFSSKAVNRFVLESGDLRLVCDNRLGDVALSTLSVPFKGTVVSVEVDRGTAIELRKVFEEFTDRKYGFSKTRIHVRLLEYGKDFVSRSEARRLLNRLESFHEAVLDFKGVESVGQGFADEVFRVFARTHPAVRLKPVNMAIAVEFMVRRAAKLRRGV